MAKLNWFQKTLIGIGLFIYIIFSWLNIFGKLPSWIAWVGWYIAIPGILFTFGLFLFGIYILLDVIKKTLKGGKNNDREEN